MSEETDDPIETTDPDAPPVNPENVDEDAATILDEANAGNGSGNTDKIDDDEIDDDDVILRQWRNEDDLPRLGVIRVDTKVDLPDGIAAGDWFLGVRVVPDPDTVDRNRNNNQRTAPLEVLVPCAPDGRDPGDNNPPGLPADEGVHDGAVCAGDTDWYAVDVGADGGLVATLTFEHSDGDLDLFVYAWDGNDVGERLGVSDGAQDREVVVLRDLDAGTYLVQVVAPRGQENSYSLDLFVD